MFSYLARLLRGAVLRVFLISLLCLSQEQEKLQSLQVGGFARGLGGAACPTGLIKSV